MKYTKSEVHTFRDKVCPKCPCTKSCVKTDSFCAGCPRIFYWKVYGTEDGTSPISKLFKTNKKV